MEEWSPDALRHPVTPDILVTLSFSSHLPISNLEPSEAKTVLRQALALYKGEFCDDAYYSWAEPTRERYRRLFIRSSARLAELLVANDEEEEATEVLERGIEVDPYCEDLHRRLIRLDAESGKVNSAFAHYEKLVAVLAKGLEVEPEPQTKALMCKIRDSSRLAKAPS